MVFGGITIGVGALIKMAYDEPWCLISDRADLTGREYACRNWQEQSFRDLKSGGWQWNHSHVWRPEHADRLLLVLWLAYALTLSFGWLAYHDQALRTQATRGSRIRYSLFRLGLPVLRDFDSNFIVTHPHQLHLGDAADGQ